MHCASKTSATVSGVHRCARESVGINHGINIQYSTFNVQTFKLQVLLKYCTVLVALIIMQYRSYTLTSPLIASSELDAYRACGPAPHVTLLGIVRNAESEVDQPDASCESNRVFDSRQSANVGSAYM